MNSVTEHCQELGERRELMAMMINKLSEEGAWDSFKAKDIPEEIVQHVLSELDLGKSPNQVRREMGIKSQTSKEWQKISSAIKMGYRVNAPTYFHRLVSRQEKMAEKLATIIEKVLDQDVQILKDTVNKEGVPLLRTYSKEITNMIDAYNRLTQGIIKNGKDLGVFAETGNEGKGGGTTIIVKSNITLKAPEAKVPLTVEAHVVGKEGLPKP